MHIGEYRRTNNSHDKSSSANARLELQSQQHACLSGKTLWPQWMWTTYGSSHFFVRSMVPLRLDTFYSMLFLLAPKSTWLANVSHDFA